MKQVKGKYIWLTEERLNQIVKKEVNKHINMLLEYAIPRAKFIDKVADLAGQILEHWCLVHYCTLIGRTKTKDHWTKELFAFLSNLSNQTIKNNNSDKSRLKAVYEGFSQIDVPTTPERIEKLVGSKFIIEDIDVQTPEFKQCIENCHNAIPSIIQVIVSGDYKAINQYISTI